MNRKKVLDYTVTRRSRDRDSRDNRDQRDRASSGDKPFWSKDDKNLIEKRGDASIRQLQDRITRKLLSPDSKTNYNTSRRTDDGRGRSKDTRVHGPIIDEFSEDAYDMRRDSKLRDFDSRDSKDRRNRNRKDSPIGKRTSGSGRSSYRDKSPSRLKNRENIQSRSSRKISGSQSNDDLRDLLKIYQKSKWDEDNETVPEKVRSGQQGKYDSERKEDVGVSSSTGLFTMSTQGTLVSIPLDPPSDTREFLSREFDRDDYRDNDNWRGDVKDKRESGDSSYQRTSRSRTNVKNRRSSLEVLRSLSKDQETDNLRYKQYDGLQMKPGEIERNLALGIQAEPDYCETLGEQGMIQGDLRNIPISELARISGKKYQSAFEMGRPFFGTAEDSKKKGWQVSEFPDSSRRGSLCNRPVDSDFSSDFDRDNNLSLLQTDREVLTDHQGRRSPVRDSSNSSRSRSGKTAYTSDKRDKNDRQSDWSTIPDRYTVTQVTVLPTKSEEKTSKAEVLPSSKPSLAPPSQKGSAKPKFPAGFLPRQVKALANNSNDRNIERSVRKVSSSTKPQSADQESKRLEPFPLKRARGYVPRFAEKSQSRSPRRSTERLHDKKDESDVGTSSREVKLPSKPKFTTQNWLHLDSRDSKPPNLVGQGGKNLRGHGGPLGRGSLLKAHGRGGAHPGKSQGNSEALATQGRVRGRGRGILRGRGRAFMRGRGGVFRGRGFIPRGRARGTVPRGKAQVGITVRNIFRRSPSLSVSSSESRRRRSSVSPSRLKESRRKDKKSRRSHSRSRSWSRSRSRSRSYCSTCSSGSCSTCASWHSSPERPSRRHSRQSKTRASVKKEPANKVDRESEKSLERIKADIKIMEEELQKKVKGSVQLEVKQEKHDEEKVKDKPRWLKDALMSKELSKDASNEVKKESENTKREVILKKDKLKELAGSKNSKGSPAREVKIINKGRQGGEKEGSKPKIDKLEITIDRFAGGSGLKRDQTKQQKNEKTPETGRKLPKSSLGKGKKKEKLKSKKTSKKSKKKKRYIDSGESEVDSDYSEESISHERKRKTEESMDSDKALDPCERHNVKGINVHYGERRKLDTTILNDSKNDLASDGSGSKNHPTRRNLISIPLPKEPDVMPKANLQKRLKVDQDEGRILNVPFSKASIVHPVPLKQEVETSDTRYPETILTGATNVDWETEGYVEEGYNENSLAYQAYSDFYEDTQENAQDEIVNEEEGVDHDNYYYEEGAEGGYYEEEYYTYQQEGDWQGDDQADDQAVVGDEQEAEHQEWQEPEYIEQGQEEEQYGQYYTGEDGQYYWVEGEGYEGQEGVEYVEEGVGGEVYDAEQGYAVDDEQYGCQYAAEGDEWQGEESEAHQLEGWCEVEGEWSGDYQEGYNYEDGSEWAEGYTVEYEGVEQELPPEGQEGAHEEAFSAEEGYEQQSVPDRFYEEHRHTQEVVHGTEQPNVQSEEFEEHSDLTETVTTPTSINTSSKDSKPLKSILKKPQAQPGNLQKSKLVSERLAQLKKQSAGMIRTSPSVSSHEPVKEQGTKVRQGDIAEGKSETDEHHEMEEAILASQSTDSIGAEYVVRVHGSGTANFYCKLCQCYFNTVTAKNLHIKGAKHIELYVRLKSSLLKSAIKDTLPETAKRSAQEQPPVLQKFPRRF